MENVIGTVLWQLVKRIRSLTLHPHIFAIQVHDNGGIRKAG